ncbi:aspartate--tRNA ligase [Egicoccus halophilus]|uniref:Aspartate--tRNA(Asp/Asn) ligase n=1 Tax=Egicoccus halophilus TaxID=1670830 RepID=A0A8J3AEU1_9ACTN|nr:aspartate--tRNA ligase [Egicoccus halophilus]GGI07327.1 aspartate--tRNA(Asp/Asn) ligase [Egicoccus halophilus]
MSITPFGALRSSGAGTLRAEHAGETVTVAGWVDTRRDHGGVAFLDLRDRSGVLQVVADTGAGEDGGTGPAGGALEAAHRVRTEWVVRVTGTVRARPEGMRNDRLATGDVELAATSIEVLSEAQTPPFPVEDDVEVAEERRLHHRYVDLRRPKMLRNLQVRAQVISIIRRVMERHGFIDVETPQLTRPTPEGARDFLVPSRLQPGTTYALPQSPQLFKQLLMVSGIERYYQIARCFRDENLRADRQPEFTQLDLELSFGDEEDVYALMEEMFAEIFAEVLDVELPTPFPRLRYDDAMRRFGSDKPDLRFAMELADLGEVFADTEVGVFQGVLASGGAVVALALPQGGELTRREFDAWTEWAKRRGAKGLAWGVVEDDGSLRSPLSKFMSDEELAGVKRETGAQPGDAVFFGAGPRSFARQLMGALRVALAEDRGLIGEGGTEQGRWEFVWVVEPPMFDPAAESDDPTAATSAGWVPNHHPFTSPAPEFLDDFEQRPGEATARAYDIVLNGTELASGSVRIHDAELQRRVFRFLGISDEAAEEKFGFLLRGFSHGVPPHAGIAPGIDRTVMLICGEKSIREVIAFPKTQTGSDPLTDAPAPYDPDALRELGLRELPRPKAD